jgi:hypothetical protein
LIKAKLENSKYTLMNQEEYYNKSRENKLPLRCPILNYCERRALTIYLNSNYRKIDPRLSPLESLIKNGDIPKDFDIKKIDNQGEEPSIMRGTGHFYCSNMCPEVNLFDDSHSLFPSTACTEGDFDKERITLPKTRILKCGHFSECPEFNLYLFAKGFKKQNLSIKKRKYIPNKTKSLLQKEINSLCPFCPNEDVDHFQIHHLDGDIANNNLENLLMLCAICHSKITKGDIKKEHVELKKRELKIKK